MTAFLTKLVFLTFLSSSYTYECSSKKSNYIDVQLTINIYGISNTKNPAAKGFAPLHFKLWTYDTNYLPVCNASGQGSLPLPGYVKFTKDARSDAKEIFDMYAAYEGAINEKLHHGKVSAIVDLFKIGDMIICMDGKPPASQKFIFETNDFCEIKQKEMLKGVVMFMKKENLLKIFIEEDLPVDGRNGYPVPGTWQFRFFDDLRPLPLEMVLPGLATATATFSVDDAFNITVHTTDFSLSSW